MEEVLKDKMKPKEEEKTWLPNAVALFKNWLSEDIGKKEPLKTYRNHLLTLLEIKDKTKIEEKYSEKLKGVASLPNANTIKELLKSAFRNFNRAKRIQPLLRKVATAWVGHDFSLKELNLFESKNPLDMENAINSLLNDLNEEISIQGAESRLGKNLIKTKEALINFYTKYLDSIYPQYAKMRAIIESIPEYPEQLYLKLLKVKPYDVSTPTYLKVPGKIFSKKWKRLVKKSNNYRKQ